MASLPAVRRLEAAGFRAWPAETVEYEGSWQKRLTPGHASRRANCLVPLDPGDTRDIGERMARIAAWYADAGTGMMVKQTPLCPQPVTAWLSEHGWVSEGEVSVQTVALSDYAHVTSLDMIPSHDVPRFVDACVAVEGGTSRTPREVMERLFSALQPETGMFILGEKSTHPKAVALCVHDGDLAGLQQVAVLAGERRHGLGRQITVAALKWARLRGAATGWLQVETANAPALALYASLGFKECYRYRYWRKEKTE
ncbi:MAG TPA: GNAT family N-acetyltransferase [Ensifer sp.]|nr:GNAT family N-acetyltransferase [Ensifer sp.]